MARPEAIITVPILDFRGFGALLVSQRTILESPASVKHLSAREVEPAIWIARNVTIHPTAHLAAPLFVGENSRIGSGSFSKGSPVPAARPLSLQFARVVTE